MKLQARSLVWVVAALSIYPISIGFAVASEAKISLRGQVVDEEGHSLGQVNLNVRKSKFSFLSESFRSNDETHHELSDGRFVVRCHSCTSVQLYISKKGYFSKTLSFRPTMIEQPNNRRDPEVAVDLELTDIEVVLRSTENAVNLTKFEGSLTTSVSGPIRVLALRSDLSKGASLEPQDISASQDVKFLPGFIQLTAETDSNGEFSALNVTDHHQGVPAEPALDFSKVDGGIVLHSVSSANPIQVYQSMRIAPPDGYENFITFENIEDPGDIYYFYVRIGGMYGKGRMAKPFFTTSDGTKVVDARIEIRLNVDGSRNVETTR